MNTTPTMLAAVLDAPGEPFRVMSVARPAPQAEQVLVRINASGVSPLETKIASGAAAHARQPLPAILGMDLAGVVEAVGARVTQFKRGDEVYGMAGGVGGLQGTLAEFAAVDADLLAFKPSNASMREAAALPLNFITAWEGLVDRACVAPGQKVLIQGGAGGVGHLAIQLAKAYRAEVFAVDSASKADFLRGLGATPIDHHELSVEAYVALHTAGRGFDLVYDTVGGATLDASFQAVRRFGHVVSCLGWGTHALAPLSFRGATYSGVFTLLPMLSGVGKSHHGEILRQAKQLTEAGKVSVRVDPRHFTLATVQEVHDAIRSRTAVGKIVIDI